MNIVELCLYFIFRFMNVLFSYHLFKLCKYPILHTILCKSKIFFKLIFKYFSKQKHRRILGSINLYRAYYASNWNYGLIQTIFLAHVCVHILFHCFQRRLTFSTNLIILLLFWINFLNRVRQLLSSQESSCWLNTKWASRMMLFVNSSFFLKFSHILLRLKHFLSSHICLSSKLRRTLNRFSFNSQLCHVLWLFDNLIKQLVIFFFKLFNLHFKLFNFILLIFMKLCQLFIFFLNIFF